MGAFRRARHALREGWPSWLGQRLYWIKLWLHQRGPRSGCRKLHVGCGMNQFAGWINSDIDYRAELIIVLGRRLPFQAGALDRIYSEHVLEHVSLPEGMAFLKEAHRVLAPGGVLRIAMPNLETLVRGYLDDDWRARFDWVNWPGHRFIETRAEMLNIAFRWWGHQHLYDRQELQRALRSAGFEQISFVRNGESDHADLRGLETRLDSDLVAEAIR